MAPLPAVPSPPEMLQVPGIAVKFTPVILAPLTATALLAGLKE
jgi:hypothetical protein